MITYFKLLLEAVNSLGVWRYSRISSQIGESWCSLPQLASHSSVGGPGLNCGWSGVSLGGFGSLCKDADVLFL